MKSQMFHFLKKWNIYASLSYMDLNPPFYENKYYHVYNRGNNRENVFYNNENYLFFLRKYDFYLSNYLDTYAYSLMPNHFHLMVQVKNFNGKPDPLKKGAKYSILLRKR